MRCQLFGRTLMTHPSGEVREVTTDVAVIGAGPCGITMANLLSLYGVRAVVIDAQPGIYEYPRAVGIDDESLRTYQAVGVVKRLLEDIVQNTPIRYYTSWGRLIAHVEPSVRPFGWPRRNNFLQPLFEATLRDRAQRHPSVTLQGGWRLAGYQQDEDGVSAEVTDAAGTARTIRARYLAAADESTLTDPGTVLKTLLAPRYGRTPLPTVLRSVIYLHHSRTAERFADR